jgi:hypothetical protein
MKWLGYFIFVILYLGLTYFGIGPVLLADGPHEERVMTFFIVVVLYLILTGSFVWWSKTVRRK